MLTGLQSSFTNQQQPQMFSSASGVASCPPYWMMFSSPQHSRLASCQNFDFLEPNSRQRSHSPVVLCPKMTIPDSEDEGESAVEKAMPSFPTMATLCRSGRRKAQKAFVPDLLNPPACLSSLPHQRRKNLRKGSLSMMDTYKQDIPKIDSQSRSLSSQRNPNTIFNTVNNHITSVNKQIPAHMVRKWSAPNYIRCER